MILYIDTTNFDKMTFALSIDGKITKKSFKIDSHRSHKSLQKLDEFLKLAKINFNPPRPSSGPPGHLLPKGEGNNVKKIVCNKGPGSFTGTRVGVTHALALGFALNVPVKFLPREKFLISK